MFLEKRFSKSSQKTTSKDFAGSFEKLSLSASTLSNILLWEPEATQTIPKSDEIYIASYNVDLLRIIEAISTESKVNYRSSFIQDLTFLTLKNGPLAWFKSFRQPSESIRRMAAVSYRLYMKISEHQSPLQALKLRGAACQLAILSKEVCMLKLYSLLTSVVKSHAKNCSINKDLEPLFEICNLILTSFDISCCLERLQVMLVLVNVAQKVRL